MIKTALCVFLQLLSVLHKAFGFCSEMNGGVLPCLMSQLMAFSCLISIVLNVSVGSTQPPSSSTAQLASLQAAGGPECPGLYVMKAEVEGWTSTH